MSVPRAPQTTRGASKRDTLAVGNAVAMMSFAAVVSTGSFSAAANWLNCSKAAVSRQIARLETSVGVKLLARTTRSIALTPAGRELYARCARIVEEVNETNRIMTGMLTRPQGDLRINAPVVASLFGVTQAIPLFLQKYPTVRIEMNLSDNKADLLQGSFDVAFWVGEPYDSNLEAVKLRDYPMVLAASPRYFSKRSHPVTPADLRDHDCIIESHLSRPGEWQLSREQKATVRTGPLKSNSVRLTREAILAGMGIAFLPRFIVEEDLAKGRLVPVLQEHVTAHLPMYVIFPKGHYVLAKVKSFVEFVQAHQARSASSH